MPANQPYANLSEQPVGDHQGTRDEAIADAIVATTSQGPPTALLSRFIAEIKHFSPRPGTFSGPKGLPLKKDFQAERLHPQHKVGGGHKAEMLDKAQQLVVTFLALKGLKANAALFVEWLQQQNLPDGPGILSLISGLNLNEQTHLVKYLDMVNRQRYVIEPGADGLLLCRKPKESPAARGMLIFDQQPYDTSHSKAAFDARQQMAIWVQGPSGRFYSSTESEYGKFHHSSFLAGREIKAAGDWQVINGKLKMISAMSGHYRPPLEALQGALQDLRRVSASLLTAAKVEVYSKDGQQIMLAATEFSKLDRSSLSQYTPSG